MASGKVAAFLDDYFGITKRGSTIATEVKGGLITFLAMVYILVVNPLILSDVAPNLVASFTATTLAAILACLLMGIYARFPIALAPGMGINVFIANTICIAMGFTFPQALMVVFVSGILFFIVSVSGIRRKLVESIPKSLKLAITAGIGLLIAAVGLFNSGIVVGTVGGTPTMGDLADPKVLLALFCIIITFVLYFLKQWGAVIIGIAATVVVGVVTNIIPFDITWENIVTVPDFSYVFIFITDFGAMSANLIPSFVVAVVSLFVVDMFDTTGTLLGVGRVAGLEDEKGNIEGIDKAFTVDATGTMIGAALGTSTTTSFIESGTGIDAGARTGLMPIVVGLLFLVALFFSMPFTTLVTNACTVGALVLVGVLMINSVKDVEWNDRVIAVAAFLTIIMMGLSGSITDGIAFGVISYVVGMMVTRRHKEVSVFMYALSVLFVVYFVIYYGVIPNL